MGWLQVFNLENNLAYTWYDIFIVLSWEKFDPYLSEIQFPLFPDISSIRPIAQNFVRNFYELRGQGYWAGKTSADAMNLSREIYQDLVHKLGETKTNILHEWGNHLQIERRKEYSLQLVVKIINHVLSDVELNSTTLASLSITKRQLLREYLGIYKEQSRLVGNSLDNLDEEMSQDEWGKSILLYYQNPKFADRSEDKTQVSPIDRLATWIYYFKGKALLNSIRELLSDEDLKELNDLLKVYPEWLEV
jgi:hypothetical protein